VAAEAELRVGVSRFVSYLLRHRPEGLAMDEEGFVDLDVLVSRVKARFPGVTRGFLVRLVEESPRKRFEVVDGRIRALYGHSVPVYLRLDEDEGVERLFHGTTEEAAEQILAVGLKPMKRRWVHLSPTRELAAEVGGRRMSEPVVLVVDCVEARRAGLKFYRASDQVFLCKFVPARYVRRLRA